jgi:hypothetical protein
MTDREIEDLARYWILYQQAWDRAGGPCMECTQLQWAYNQVDDLVIDWPEESWKLLLAVRRRDRSEMIEQILAAAVFEDLMALHGSKLIDRVEEEARRNPSFVGVILASYKASMSDQVWNRLKAVVGSAVTTQVA